MDDHRFEPDPRDPLTRGNLQDFALATLVGHAVIFILNAFLPLTLPAMIGPIMGVVFAGRGHVRKRGGQLPPNGSMWTFAFGATGIAIVIQALLIFMIGPMLPKGEDALAPMAQLGATIGLVTPIIFILIRVLFSLTVRRGLRAKKTQF